MSNRFTPSTVSLVLLAVLLLQPLTLTSAFAGSDTLQMSRYTTVSTKPTAAQINPLMAVIQVHFPANVVTVGEAVHYILRYSGYDLGSPLSLSAKTVLGKPLPWVNRTMGPIELREALVVLMGKNEFSLVQNPIERTVNFKLKSAGQTL